MIDGCQDSSFDQASDPRTLYNQAHDLESTDPERAAILYQRLLNRAPTYAGGRAQVDLDRLNQQFYSQRAQGLRERAESARKEGQYGAEAGALKALIALGGQDRNVLAWAEEYLPIAEQNSAWLDTYENVKHFVANGDLGGARDLLAYLWQTEHARFFRDPAGVAPRLGLTVPMTYEEVRDRRRADEIKSEQESEATSELHDLIEEARDFPPSTYQTRLRNAARGHRWKERGPEADELAHSIAAIQGRLEALRAQSTAADSRASAFKDAVYPGGLFRAAAFPGAVVAFSGAIVY